MEEIFQIEAKYHELKAQLHADMNNTISGKKKSQKNSNKEDGSYEKIPQFWYKAMMNNKAIKKSIKKDDKPILELL